MAVRDIPNVDFSQISADYEGKWLLVRVGEVQKVVASASTPEAAMNSRPDLDDDPLVILTKAPTRAAIAAVSRVRREKG